MIGVSTILNLGVVSDWSVGFPFWVTALFFGAVFVFVEESLINRVYTHNQIRDGLIT